MGVCRKEREIERLAGIGVIRTCLFGCLISEICDFIFCELKEFCILVAPPHIVIIRNKTLILRPVIIVNVIIAMIFEICFAVREFSV